MSEEASFAAPDGLPASDTIDITDDAQVQRWAGEFNATAEQIRDAVKQVGTNASDVEEYLKGTRSTTNADRTKTAS